MFYTIFHDKGQVFQDISLKNTSPKAQKSTHIASFISNFTVGKEIFMVAHGADIGSVDIFRLYPGFHKNDLIGPPQI